jgi:hypothetical protein
MGAFLKKGLSFDFTNWSHYSLILIKTNLLVFIKPPHPALSPKLGERGRVRGGFLISKDRMPSY